MDCDLNFFKKFSLTSDPQTSTSTLNFEGTDIIFKGKDGHFCAACVRRAEKILQALSAQRQSTPRGDESSKS
jgi:hypothetical protein